MGRLKAVTAGLFGAYLFSSSVSGAPPASREDYCHRPSQYLCDLDQNAAMAGLSVRRMNFQNRWGNSFHVSAKATEYRKSLGYAPNSPFERFPEADRNRYQDWMSAEIVRVEFTPVRRQKIAALFEDLRARLIRTLQERVLALKGLPEAARTQVEKKIERLRSLRYSFDPLASEANVKKGRRIVDLDTSGYNHSTNRIYLAGDFSFIETDSESLRWILAHEISHVLFYTDYLGSMAMDTSPAVFAKTREQLRTSLGVKDFPDAKMNEIMADWMAGVLVESYYAEHSPSAAIPDAFAAATFDLAKALEDPRLQSLSSWFCAVDDRRAYDGSDDSGHLSLAKRLDTLVRQSPRLGCAD